MPPLCANPPSTALAFVQLSMRPPLIPSSISSSSSSSPSILPLLLPRAVHLHHYHHHVPVPVSVPVAVPRQPTGAAPPSLRHGAAATSTATSFARRRRHQLQLQPLPQSGIYDGILHHSHDGAGAGMLWAASRRAFGMTGARRATLAVFNPQQDAEGNEMKVEITQRAAKRLSEIMAKDDNPHLALRIQVESGGCHGFQYLMSLVTLPPALPSSPSSSTSSGGEGEKEPVVREDDTIFTYAQDDVAATQAQAHLAAPKIIMDAPSLELLQGSKVDFTMELIGSQFKIVDNPHATSSCGCGTSFDIKI